MDVDENQTNVGDGEDYAVGPVVHERLKDGLHEKFSSSCFGRYLKFWTEGASCSSAIHAVLGQEVTIPGANPNELWFRVGDDQFTRLSKYEFALITGLRFGESDFDPNAQHDVVQDGVYARLIRGRARALVSKVLKQFEDGQYAAASADDQLKIAKILFLYGFVFGVDGYAKAVDKWAWCLVEDEHRWENFPWGKYSYQFLLKGLRCTVPKEQKQPLIKYHFDGFALAFLVWAYEAIPALAQTCVEHERRTDLQRPRFVRWRFNWNHLDVSDFFAARQVSITCHETLEPYPEELQEYEWWHHVNNDLSTGIRFVRRKTRGVTTKPRKGVAPNLGIPSGPGGGGVVIRPGNSRDRLAVACVNNSPPLDVCVSSEAAAMINNIEGTSTEHGETQPQTTLEGHHALEGGTTRATDNVGYSAPQVERDNYTPNNITAGSEQQFGDRIVHSSETCQPAKRSRTAQGINLDSFKSILINEVLDGVKSELACVLDRVGLIEKQVTKGLDQLERRVGDLEKSIPAIVSAAVRAVLSELQDEDFDRSIPRKHNSGV
ncbi:hypothetical protein PHJA_001532400 [Phtheirospermum japonicum]|uniref:DUF1985 domain-containing protein n=1 Tax=Phtheirospermum japonicum TaxID=374723 RepID=A0A830CHL7_9LAMI|nr:hypothetical protein PHJA_001532400 [Phtheirospermum japonicum]